MVKKVTYNLKLKSPANLPTFIYHINTNKHKVGDTRKYFEFDVALLADKKRTTAEELLKYYNDSPDVVDIKVIGEVY